MDAAADKCITGSRRRPFKYKSEIRCNFYQVLGRSISLSGAGTQMSRAASARPELLLRPGGRSPRGGPTTGLQLERASVAHDDRLLPRHLRDPHGLRHDLPRDRPSSLAPPSNGTG